jgi:cell wall-associated NlpC family hydrolase
LAIGIFDGSLFAAQTKPVPKATAKKAIAKKTATKKSAAKKKTAKAAKTAAAKKSSTAKTQATPTRKASAKSFAAKSPASLRPDSANDKKNASDQANGPSQGSSPEKDLAADLSEGEKTALLSEDRELIDFTTVTKGLTGRLTTGSAGADFLAKYGRLPRRAAVSDADKLAALDYDTAPRSTRYLRMGQGVTNRILANAYSQTGRPYQEAGKNPMTGFDDAGLVMWLFAQEGIRLPAQASAQVAAGQAVARDELRPGDVLVYRSPKEASYTVGVYAGNGNFVLASKRHRGVTEAAAFDPENAPYFVGGRRFLDDPKATPLSDEIKTQATNGAVKLALAELGDNLPKPANIYGGSAKKVKSKAYRKSKSSRRGSKAKASAKKAQTNKSVLVKAK